METIEEVLKANEVYAKNFKQGNLPTPRPKSLRSSPAWTPDWSCLKFWTPGLATFT